jgi:hypothetical protein
MVHRNKTSDDIGIAKLTEHKGKVEYLLVLENYRR